MKKIITIILVITLIFISTTVVYSETGFVNVSVKFRDLDDTEIKETVIESYQSGSSVSIDLNNLSIEGYKIEEVISSETVIQTDNTLNIDSIENDEEIIIRYIKLNSYKVIYTSNDSDGTKIIKEEVRYGLPGETIPKENDYETIFGYRFSGSNEEKINEDNSAVVNINYTKDSFNVYFDLNDEMSEPLRIYQKYETKIENIEEPQKEGYEFIGWFKEKECLNKVDSDNLYVLGETTYYAGYIKTDETALVTIVFYGENANDQRYSYLGKIEKQLPIGSSYSYDPNFEEEHYYKTHDLSCYGVTDLKPAELHEIDFEGFKLLSPELEEGYVYVRVDNQFLGKDTSYYYLSDGNFYKTDKYHISYQIGETKRLKDRVLKDDFRLFKAAVSCGDEYEFEKSDTITVHKTDNLVYVYLKRNVYTLSFGNDDNFPNDYYGKIEAKWGSLIFEQYEKITEKIGDNHGWTQMNKRDEGVLKFMITMPKENNNYYASLKRDGSRKLNYHLKMNGEYIHVYSTYWQSGTKTSEADYIEIDGYELNVGKSIKLGTTLASEDDANNIFYDPKDYDLVLVSYVDESKIFKVPYGSTLSIAKDYKPVPRYDYQSFAGWYLNQDLSGEKIDLETKPMPSFNLTLFAKWDRTLLNVRFIDEKEGYDETFKIPYDDLVESVPVNNNPDFIGYVKEGSNLIVNFKNYKITKDEIFYAMYDQDELLDYKINYLTKDYKEVASPTFGSILKGNKIYIYPKTSNNLIPEYKGEYKAENKSYVFEVEHNNQEFNIFYIPFVRYDLTLIPSGLYKNDSVVLYLNGKGFNNLEIALNKEVTVKDLYEDENYVISFDNTYSKTYQDLDSISFSSLDDKTINIKTNKIIKNYFNTENHKINIFD